MSTLYDPSKDFILTGAIIRRPKDEYIEEIKRFTEDEDWVIPNNIKDNKVLVTIIGAGGTASSYMNGGRAKHTTEEFILTPGEIVEISIGMPGTLDSGDPDVTVGGNGGPTSFGKYMYVNGGISTTDEIEFDTEPLFVHNEGYSELNLGSVGCGGGPATGNDTVVPGIKGICIVQYMRKNI